MSYRTVLDSADIISDIICPMSSINGGEVSHKSHKSLRLVVRRQWQVAEFLTFLNRNEFLFQWQGPGQWHCH